MPRRKKRRKPYSPADWTSQRAKTRFPFSLFTNVKVFYVLGALIMVGGLGIGAIARTTRSSSSTSNDVVTPGDETPTPEATAVVRAYDGPPPLSIDTTKQYFADIETDKGVIRVKLLADEAPETVNNFVFLARDGFYDGLSFFYVNPDWIAMSGDPTSAGEGGPGYDLPQEKPEPQETFAKGDVGMVNASQFFIAYRNLDASSVASQESTGYTPFGHVVEGMDVLASLTPRSPTATDAAPADHIVTIKIEEV
jgi:cyclophilin family peptidyl-prolyl cis-trans isomerase